MIAAGVVAWQSWETRKSARASQEAVVAANAALELAREQVDEAVRARIDGSMAHIAVRMPVEPEWPPLEPAREVGGEPQPIAPGTAYRHPLDERREILVRVPLQLVNESSVRARLDVGGVTDRQGKTISEPLELEPGEVFEGYFAVTRFLSEWVESWWEGARDQAAFQTYAYVYYSSATDPGAMDTWELRLRGTPVEMVQSSPDVWRVVDSPNRHGLLPGTLWAEQPVRRRRYSLSTLKGESLPD